MRSSVRWLNDRFIKNTLVYELLITWRMNEWEDFLNESLEWMINRRREKWGYRIRIKLYTLLITKMILYELI